MPTRWPEANSWRTIATATAVLPTSVSVPVTNRPPDSVAAAINALESSIQLPASDFSGTTLTM